ncbi:hypothetical protein [Paenibacillus caui]|uniref:hypothetical protein n=1 Tax=Paenibacillus caui TaxID=2873927 RepID=UPI001CA8BC17|nr:hypothetical protein [Paenibacillus caui]
MLSVFIVGCEIAFWLFVLAGLVCRYLLRLNKTGMVLLLLTPVVDLILLGVTVVDLQRGAAAGFAHGLAAVYIGVSITYGHRMVRWADIRFAHRFAGGPAPVKKAKFGKEHARNQRHGWFLHLVSWAIGCSLLYGIILWVNEDSQTEALLQVIRLWSVVLVIDFLISFSYTLWPRVPKETTASNQKDS